MKKFSYLLLIVSVFVAVATGCKKSDSFDTPPEAATFTNLASGTYLITGPAVSYKIPVGLTTVSTQDRTVNIEVTSPSGAVEGTHYTIASKSITIPAGQVIDSITVQGIYSQYLTGRKDTLIFTIVEPGAKPSDYNQKFTLVMRGPCFESEIAGNFADLLGDYDNTNELFGSSAYGPYTTTILSATQTSPTTGTITVGNIWDSGWNPITFTLDWTDVNNRKVTLVQQSGIGNAGTINSAYNGMDISVRPFGTQVGTFSYCNQTLTLKMQLGVTGLGWFGSLYTVNMAR